LFEVGKRSILTVERLIEAKAQREEPLYPLTIILEIATDMGVDDLSTRHDRHAHGRWDDGETTNLKLKKQQSEKRV